MQVPLLLGVWVLLSGKLDPFHLSVGILVVAYVVWQHGRLPPISKGKPFPQKPLRVLVYVGWLLWQIMLAAIYVARVILWPKKHLDPRMIKFRSEQPTFFHAVMLANSITLTPGTLTIDLEENVFLVHALTEATAQDVLDGGMAARVARLCCDEPIPPPQELVVTQDSYSL